MKGQISRVAMLTGPVIHNEAELPFEFDSTAAHAIGRVWAVGCSETCSTICQQPVWQGQLGPKSRRLRTQRLYQSICCHAQGGALAVTMEDREERAQTGLAQRSLEIVELRRQHARAPHTLRASLATHSNQPFLDRPRGMRPQGLLLQLVAKGAYEQSRPVLSSHLLERGPMPLLVENGRVVVAVRQMAEGAVGAV